MQLPPLWKMFFLEILMTLAAILALVITVGLAVVGLFKKKAWSAIPKLWAPWWGHWRVWKWSWKYFRDPEHNSDNMEVLADQEAEEKPRTTREHVVRRMPVIYPEDVFVTMFVGSIAVFYGWIIIALIISLVGGWAVHAALISVNTDVRPGQVTAAPTATHENDPQQKQALDLKPMMTDRNEVTKLRTKSGVNNFIMINTNGEVQYSAKWTVSPKDPAWGPSTSSYIKTSVLSGTAVAFTDQRSTDYNVNVDMPIYFANNTAVIFMFDESGHLMQAVRDDVQKVSIDSVKSPASPNPKLSIL